MSEREGGGRREEGGGTNVVMWRGTAEFDYDVVLSLNLAEEFLYVAIERLISISG